MSATEVTQERLRSLLSYDPQTGAFAWRHTRGSHVAGKIAGRVIWDGHRRICIDYREYGAHRLAWLYVHGSWPEGVVDHINGNPDDNRLENLRDVSQAFNMQNQFRAHKSKRNGKLLGAFWSARSKRWLATISVRGRNQHIGYYDTEQEAHEAYLARKRIVHAGSTL